MNTRLMIERTKANKAGDCTVYIEVSSSGNNQKKRTVRIPTAIKVHVDNWSVKGQAVVRGKSKDYYKINQMLIGQKQLVMEIIADLSQKGAFQLSDIKKIYKEKTSPIILGFFEIYDEFLMRRDVSMTRNGVKDYKTLRSHLVSFESYRKERIILREVDHVFFEEFEVFLSTLTIKSKSKDNGETIAKKYADSTISKNLQILRLFLNFMVNQGLPVNPNYKKYKIRSNSQAALITLEADEYRLLRVKVENERLENVRKLFVLQCATGLRFSDVIKIRKSHIRNNTIHLNSTKTRQKLQIPLNGNAREILEEINFDTSKIAISNQKYNDYIKELCELVGIDQSIMKVSFRGNREEQQELKKFEIMSSHHGRRFFITQNLINGVRPEVIMSMTGHVDFRSFKKYIAITDQTRVNAMDLWSQTFG